MNTIKARTATLQQEFKGYSDKQLENALLLVHREQWIRAWATVYLEYNGRFSETPNRFQIVTFLPCKAGEPCRVGWSRWNCRDSFDHRVAVAVATARAFGEDIPDYI